MVFEKAGAQLPERCVVCNRDTDYKLKRTFVWHPWWVFVLAPLGWIFYAVIASAVRKYATVELGLCEEHQQRRRSGLIITGFGVGASVLLLLIASSSRWGGMALAALVCLVVAIVLGGRMTRVATSKKIDDTHAWLRVGEPFLASLPDSPDGAPEPPRRVKKKTARKAGTKKPVAAAESQPVSGSEPSEGDGEP